jgi:acyl-CoA dehydrogenase-like protein
MIVVSGPAPALLDRSLPWLPDLGRKCHPGGERFSLRRNYSRELPLERMARDVRIFTIGGGTAEVLRNVVAGALLKKKLPQTRDGWAKAD